MATTRITSKISKKKVSINREGGKNSSYWKVTFPKVGGGRQRRFFPSEADADIFIEQQQIQFANYGAAGAAINDKLRIEAVAADELLKPLGVSIIEAAKHYAAFLTSTRGGIPLAKAVEQFKATRSGSAYSPIYQKALAHRLKHFVEALPDKPPRQITPTEIDTFLTSRGAVESQKSYRSTIKSFFNFLVEEGQCEKNPVRKGKSEEVAYSVEILTPDQCQKLLAACDPDTLSSVAIGMFCGLRSSEIERLDWSKVNLTESVIILDSGVARKTGSRRVVPIHATCKEWLLPYAKTSGKVQPVDFRNAFDRVRVKAGFKPSFSKRNDDTLQELLKAAKADKVKLISWPSNCLRHSAISYAMADCGDQSKVASWAGNSPAMIKKHYDAQATPSASKAFYSILPTTPGNVEAFKQPKAAVVS